MPLSFFTARKMAALSPLSRNCPVVPHLAKPRKVHGMEDDAWILLSTQNKAWGLFIFLKQNPGVAVGNPLNIFDPEKYPGVLRPQQMGVEVVIREIT